MTSAELLTITVNGIRIRVWTDAIPYILKAYEAQAKKHGDGHVLDTDVSRWTWYRKIERLPSDDSGA